mmetsp:Transcript_120070/g.233888  ORF Transcript_120070/g.233888 Transcript_120070/m.233888 type:complete len:98 (+) Transcript_120070:617-910(+)
MSRVYLFGMLRSMAVVHPRGSTAKFCEARAVVAVGGSVDVATLRPVLLVPECHFEFGTDVSTFVDAMRGWGNGSSEICFVSAPSALSRPGGGVTTSS